MQRCELPPASSRPGGEADMLCPDQVIVTLKAGSMILFHEGAFHGTHKRLQTMSSGVCVSLSLSLSLSLCVCVSFSPVNDVWPPHTQARYQMWGRTTDPSSPSAGAPPGPGPSHNSAGGTPTSWRSSRPRPRLCWQTQTLTKEWCTRTRPSQQAWRERRRVSTRADGAGVLWQPLDCDRTRDHQSKQTFEYFK